MNPHAPHPDDNAGTSAPPDGTSGGQTGTSGGQTGTSQVSGGTSGERGGMSRDHAGPPPQSPPPDAQPGTAPRPQPPNYSRPAPDEGSPSGFFDWIRSLGVARGRDRWIGGVAGGIAQRFGVDPLIVRGVLIVLTIFAGVGVLLYGIAWALLPEPDGRIHAQEAVAGRWTTGMTGALITALIGLPGLGNGVWGWEGAGFGAAWTVVWVGGVVYFIYYLSRRGKTPDGVAASYPRPDGPRPAGAATAPPPLYGQPGTAPPPLYGQAGTAPPPPLYTVPVPAPGAKVAAGGPRGSVGPGAAAVAITAGAALIAGGGLQALDATNVIELGPAGTAAAWAGAAAVLGLGIVISGLRGRTSGVLGFFAVVALVVSAISSVAPTGDQIRFSSTDWSPASLEQARAGLDIVAGSGTADLTGLALSPPLERDVIIPFNATAGDLTIIIPDTVPVRIDADLTMSSLDEASRSRGGTTNVQRGYNTTLPGASLILKISGTMSSISIKEGN